MEHPNLSTAADVIGKQFFYALGYNVPENHIIYLHRESLVIDPGAQISLPGGKKSPVDQEYLDFMLDNAARLPDGTFRAVARLMIEGELLGAFKFYGTRPDDPNEIFPHEHRRELRGYRVFCAWLNHDDSRSINTLDVFLSKGGRRLHQALSHRLRLDSGKWIGPPKEHIPAESTGGKRVPYRIRTHVENGLYVRNLGTAVDERAISLSKVPGDRPDRS